MDDLDRALLEAWGRLTPRLRADRLEAARRAGRRASAMLSRPVRAWCLCLRAADSRLEGLAAVAPYSALRINAPHTLYLDAPAIRKLVAPVHIDWPGIRLRTAAGRLGHDPAALGSWVRRGVLQVRYDAPSMHGTRGKPVPVVWSASPLDPNANMGRAPDPVWGSMWRYHHTRVPDGLTLIVNREMAYRYHRYARKDLGAPRGWMFVCPGLGEGTGGRAASGTGQVRLVEGRPVWPEEPEDHPPITCGRLARRLYCPLPVIDMVRLLGEDPLEGVEEWIGAEGGFERPRPVFACTECHRLRHTHLQGVGGWGPLIAQLTGGVLYGHEVERPREHEYKRKRRYTAHVTRSPRRDRVLVMLLAGVAQKQIAAELGITVGTVVDHAVRIYRLHNVHSRAELCRELGVPVKRELSAVLAATRDALLEGGTYAQVAERLGVGLNTMKARVYDLYRFYGVHSRRELRERVGRGGQSGAAAGELAPGAAPEGAARGETPIGSPQRTVRRTPAPVNASS